MRTKRPPAADGVTPHHLHTVLSSHVHLESSSHLLTDSLVCCLLSLSSSLRFSLRYPTPNLPHRVLCPVSALGILLIVAFSASASHFHASSTPSATTTPRLPPPQPGRRRTVTHSSPVLTHPSQGSTYLPTSPPLSLPSLLSLPVLAVLSSPSSSARCSPPCSPMLTAPLPPSTLSPQPRSSRHVSSSQMWSECST
jgi:hypothetical protein